jgi:hypothetical protein
MRFGHTSYDKLVDINKQFTSVKISKTNIPCDTCFYAMQKRLPFPLSSTISENVFDIVHLDILGPLSIPSMSGFKYFLTVVDDKSRFTWIYLMKLRSETSNIIQSFVAMVNTQFNIKVKCIRSDNGHEFKLHKFYNEHRIIHQSSCVGTPQQNGVVERKHQHILDTARALLFNQNYLKKFGLMLFVILYTLSIGCLHLSCLTSYLFKFLTISYLIFLPPKSLVHYVFLLLFLLIERN